MKTSPFGEGSSNAARPQKLAVSRDAVAHNGRLPPLARSPGPGLQCAPDGPSTPPSSCSWRRSPGCGETTVRQEPSITVTGGDARRDEAPGAPAGEDAPRIAVVTHGQASSPFWAIVRTGVEAAERQMNVQVDYEAPDVYSLARMIELDRRRGRRQARTASSSPSPSRVWRPRSAAPCEAGIPVITINSGSDAFRSLGVLAHVGQPEGRAGLAAGRRLARAGVRRALCVNQQVGNVGLDARCDGLAARDARGRRHARACSASTTRAPTRRRKIAARRRLRAGSTASSPPTPPAACSPSTRSRRPAARAKVAAFDLGPDTLRAVEQGKLLFAVDQQPYLQGYLPVVMLANRARYGLLPAQGDVVATGANFVTRDERRPGARAQRALDPLNARQQSVGVVACAAIAS